MVDCLLVLIAEETGLSSFEAVPSTPIRSPVTASESQPEKYLHPQRRPGFPDEPVTTERPFGDVNLAGAACIGHGSIPESSHLFDCWIKKMFDCFVPVDVTGRRKPGTAVRS